MKINQKILRDIIYEALGGDKQSIQKGLATQAVRKSKVASMSPQEVQAMKTLQTLETLISQPGNQMNAQMLTLLTRIKATIDKLTQKQKQAAPAQQQQQVQAPAQQQQQVQQQVKK